MLCYAASCCCVTLIIWVYFCVPTAAQIRHSFFTCGTSCSPQHIRTYVKRRCWKNYAGCFLNTEHIHLFPAWYRPRFFVLFYVYQVDYSSWLLYILIPVVITRYLVSLFFLNQRSVFPWNVARHKAGLKKTRLRGRLDADCCIDLNTFWFVFNTKQTMRCCLHCLICMYTLHQPNTNAAAAPPHIDALSSICQ